MFTLLVFSAEHWSTQDVKQCSQCLQRGNSVASSPEVVRVRKLANLLNLYYPIHLCTVLELLQNGPFCTKSKWTSPQLLLHNRVLNGLPFWAEEEILADVGFQSCGFPPASAEPSALSEYKIELLTKAFVCRSPHVRGGAHCWRADLTPPYKRLLSSRPELCKVTTKIICVNKFATDNKAPYLINIKQRAYVVQDCVELIQHGDNFQGSAWWRKVCKTWRTVLQMYCGIQKRVF